MRVCRQLCSRLDERRLLILGDKLGERKVHRAHLDERRLLKDELGELAARLGSFIVKFENVAKQNQTESPDSTVPNRIK